MGRSASAGDNTAIESFWVLLQRNVLNTGAWRTRPELHYAITYWIERNYNTGRYQRGQARFTPFESELAFTSNITPAAT